MKVGDYVRTYDGYIGKIIDINLGEEEKRYEIDYNNKLYYYNQVSKSSSNIIDLIEVGDYVNGKLVEKTFDKTNYADKSIKLKGSGDYWYNEHIKSIVTKEQFEEMEYKL